MAPLSSEERAQIVANNKSLRIIKNELEALAERGILTDDMYDTIMSTLPAEAPLRAGAGGAAFSSSTPTPRAEAVVSPPPAANPSLTSSFASMSMSNPSPSPSLPQRNPTPQPPPAPPRKPEIAHAVALYEYHASDAGDLALVREDHISVTEYMNAEWWSGINVRTGSEGIFPKNYVRVENFPSTLAANPSAPPPQYNEKNPYSTPQPQYSGGYPGQPVYNQQQPAQNPYNNSVPPMAVANDSSGQAADPENGKGKMYAKKFGGKLGNAAIFGAGATIGGNIVNSIF